MSQNSSYPVSRDFRVSFEELRVVARGVKRPECVLAIENGELLASHGDGGYVAEELAPVPVGAFSVCTTLMHKK